MAASRAMKKVDNDFNVGFDATGAVRYRGTGIGTYTYQLAFNLHDMTNGNISFLLPGAEYDNLHFDDSAVWGRMLNNPGYYREITLICIMFRKTALACR